MEVLLKVFDNEALAQLWAGILEDQGIKTLVRPAAGSFPLPYHGPFIPHAVFVLEEDEERARALLDEEQAPP